MTQLKQNLHSSRRDAEGAQQNAYQKGLQGSAFHVNNKEKASFVRFPVQSWLPAIEKNQGTKGWV